MDYDFAMKYVYGSGFHKTTIYNFVLIEIIWTILLPSFCLLIISNIELYYMSLLSCIKMHELILY